MKQTRQANGAPLPHLEKADLMRERGLDLVREVFGEHHVTAGANRPLAENVLLMEGGKCVCVCVCMVCPCGARKETSRVRYKKRDLGLQPFSEH